MTFGRKFSSRVEREAGLPANLTQGENRKWSTNKTPTLKTTLTSQIHELISSGARQPGGLGEKHFAFACLQTLFVCPRRRCVRPANKSGEDNWCDDEHQDLPHVAENFDLSLKLHANWNNKHTCESCTQYLCLKRRLLPRLPLFRWTPV